jgi:hypothetical protein
LNLTCRRRDILFRMALFCWQCNRFVNYVVLPDFRCRICSSLFIDTVDNDLVPPHEHQRLQYERLGTNSRGSNPGESFSRERTLVRPRWGIPRIPLPPPPPIRRAPQQRPQLFVTPDGRIVDRLPHTGPSESELQRRHATLIMRPLTATEDPNCCICMDEHMNTVTTVPGCGHGFHEACIKRWLERKNSCPLCNVDLP